MELELQRTDIVSVHYTTYSSLLSMVGFTMLHGGKIRNDRQHPSDDQHTT